MNGRSAILAVPIVFGTLLLVAGAAWLVAVQLTHGTAHGPPIAVRLSSDCADAAISARLDAWGLPATWEGRVVRFPGPGQPDDTTHMPAALLTPGVLVLRKDAEVIPAALRHAGVQISLEGVAVSLLTFDRALPDGVTATLDGAPVRMGSVNGGELQIESDAAASVDALRDATDRVVWLRFPLPCAVTGEVVGTTDGRAPGDG